MAATAANESWKPGLEETVRVPGEQDGRARRAGSTSGRAAGRPSHASDASPPATPARTTDGCQPTASTYAATVAERAGLADPARKPERPDEQDRPRDDVRDVLARDGQEVVEAGRPEAVAEIRLEPLVLAEHDAGEDRAALPAR